MNLPIIGVIGSGRGAPTHERRAEQIGEWLATEGVHLLTGGGGGLMATVSRAFHKSSSRRGLVIGVIPCVENDPAVPKKGYPNEWVEIPIFTHLPLSGDRGADQLSRNHINVLSSKAIIALPGGEGTLSEIILALKYKPRAVAAYLAARRDIDGLPDHVPVYSRFGEIQEFIRAILRA